MQSLLLSPASGMFVLNLVAASLLISAAALAAASLARRADSLKHSLLCVGLLFMALSPLSVGAMNQLGFGIWPIPQATSKLANRSDAALPNLALSPSVPPPSSEIVEPAAMPAATAVDMQTPNGPSLHDRQSPPKVDRPDRTPSSVDATQQDAAAVPPSNRTGGIFVVGVSLFLFVWVAVSLTLIVRFGVGLLVVRRLRASLLTSTDARLVTAAERIQSDWKISASVAESNLAPAPLTLGLLRPVIVIPVGLVSALDEEELECVLSHEAAHVVRRDTTVALFQQLTAVVFWWNPLLRAINRRIGELRERLCDASVAQRRGDGISLARALVAVAAWSTDRWGQLPLVAPLLEEEGLEQRVMLLASAQPPATSGMNRWSRGLLVGFAFVLGSTSIFPLMRFEAAAAPSDSPAPRQNEMRPTDPAAPEVAAAEKAAPQPSVWPAGTTVMGRVVDHRGLPVENASVLLLGQERIMVDAERKTWFALDRSSAKPAETKTNSNGEFAITREQGDANRIAVIADDPLFWVVSHDSLAQGNEVEVKLPASGKLAVHCNLPSKPAQLPVMIQLASFDGKSWDADSLRFHMSSFSLVNPGKQVFDRLPPAWYAVQFYTESKAGNSVLLTDMDREIVEVAADQEASVTFERKVGRPLTGRVVGLENADLKYARLTIQHLGPEEVVNNSGRRGRRLIAFDVISIDSEGEFTTDPLPPGEYYADLFAVLASTPHLSSQTSDFSGQTTFTIPEQGELPQVEVKAKAQAPRDLSKLTDFRIRAVDEAGKPIAKLQAMIHTADSGYGLWTDGRNGMVFLGGPYQYRSDVLDVFVRADGYASGFIRLEGAQQRAKLSSGDVTMTLRRGTAVQLQLNPPAGMTWPSGTMPETYFDNMEQRIRTMRQAVNRAVGGVPDFNFLNLRDVGDGRFEFRLAEDTPRFHAAVHAPGFLQYFEADAYTLADVKEGRIEIDLPQPATIEATFASGELPPADSLFKTASLTLMRRLQGDSYLTVATSEPETLKPTLTVTDLAPGDYLIDVRTEPKVDGESGMDSSINPGRYFDRRRLTLTAGQRQRVDFETAPYQPNAFRGSRTAILRIKTPDGRPAIDRPLEVSYFDGHYGSQSVFAGTTPASGEIVLSKITDKVPSTSFAGRAFTVKSAGKMLGSFSFASPDKTEEFEFFLAPGEGDLAPDVKLTNLASGQAVDLTSFRGKVVLLEFWATWCGPCQQPMEKLNLLAEQRSADWKDRVAIVPINIDGDRDRAAAHIQSRGWTKLDHYLTGTEAQSDFDAEAARRFVVSGVPESILIGPDGRILWRGHPLAQYSGKNVESLINDALR